MKKLIGMILSFILIFTCSTTTFAADTTNIHSENLPHNGDAYFETEIRVDNEKNERIADFVTVYGYQYTQGSLKYGAWRNGASGRSNESASDLSFVPLNPLFLPVPNPFRL